MISNLSKLIHRSQKRYNTTNAPPTYLRGHEHNKSNMKQIKHTSYAAEHLHPRHSLLPYNPISTDMPHPNPFIPKPVF
ncbi:hypothetical protein XFEB_00017 [Xylella fastidiosa EB92.1]|nr:hypothetical protein XFEB_00017 [Xylella fastidiosa EB92.1]